MRDLKKSVLDGEENASVGSEFRNVNDLDTKVWTNRRVVGFEDKQ